MSDVVLPGVGPNSPPGVSVSLLFEQGQTSLPSEEYAVIILANITSQGTAYPVVAGTVYGPNTLVPLQTAQQASSLFGNGSPAALGFAAFIAQNKSTPCYVCPVTAASGTQASQTVTLTTSGTQSTGVIRYRIDQKAPVDTVFAAGDSVGTIAANMAANINGQVNLPVTASSNMGALTITAKVAGARGNWLRGFAQVVSGTGIVSSVLSPTFFTSGAGSDAAGYTAAMTALEAAGLRYYYYITEAGFDSVDGYVAGSYSGTQIDIVQTGIDLMSNPATGLRSRLIAGSVDTVANTVQVSTSANDPRVECLNCKNLDLTPLELAASWCAAITLFEQHPIQATGVNFDGFGGDPASQPFWNVAAPLDGTAPSVSDIQTAVVSGVSILRVVAGGRTNVVERCTSRFLTPSGATNVLDLRIRDAGVVTVCDQFFDDVQAALVESFPRKLIGKDPPRGAPPAGSGVATPSKIENCIQNVIAQYSAAGVIDGPSVLDGMSVVVNASNPSSFGITIPLFTNNLAHQFLVQGLQINAIVV